MVSLVGNSPLFYRDKSTNLKPIPALKVDGYQVRSFIMAFGGAALNITAVYIWLVVI